MIEQKYAVCSVLHGVELINAYTKCSEIVSKFHQQLDGLVNVKF